MIAVLVRHCRTQRMVDHPFRSDTLAITAKTKIHATITAEERSNVSLKKIGDQEEIHGEDSRADPIPLNHLWKE